MKLIIDTHLDLAWNALGWDRDITRSVAEINSLESGMEGNARGRATTSLPEMRLGRVAVCLATVMARVNPRVRPVEGPSRVSIDHPNHRNAYAVAQGQLAYYRLLESEGQIRFIRNLADLDAHWQEWRNQGRDDLPIGIILAMEGADPIAEPDQAADWFEDGLRSVSLAHYGKSRYAVGTGQSGPLSDAGVELLKQFDRLGMILDVTHLSQPGFFQALDSFGGPIMASHNNCRALVPGDRQFSDTQIRRLIDRDALIGVALDAWMLHAGWIIGETDREVVGLEAVADHVDHVCQLAGNCRHVGIGSDLDGGYGTEQTPHGVETIADLQKLADVFSDRGYADQDVAAVFHGNCLEFFRRWLPK